MILAKIVTICWRVLMMNSIVKLKKTDAIFFSSFSSREMSCLKSRENWFPWRYIQEDREGNAQTYNLQKDENEKSLKF